MSRIIPTIIAASVIGVVAVPAVARTRHHHSATRAAPSQAVAEAPRPFEFYPQQIDGGVSGNLPFNNQIRKHTDGLNANGGR